MKRFGALFGAVLLLSMLLFGCNTSAPTSDFTQIVCTIFPQYDWVMQILGDNSDMEVTLLLDSKVDLHSYQPTVEDIAKISTCDLFIYVGGESDEWVRDALKSATNKNMATINLLDVLGGSAKEEEVKEGMEHGEGEHEHGLDEHVWLSLSNAQIFCAAITEALADLDAENAAEYRQNLAAYNDKLSELDAEYRSAVDNALTNTLLFGDRFPFRYLVDDYGLDYYAAFAGCSAETEASFETIVFLAGKVDELSLKSILVTESTDTRVAETIRSNTADKNQQILVLDSMQSVSRADITDGATYLGIMGNNLHVLFGALN